ncbi:MAG: bifunctional oligoribonuclease/PAP phosphatase NrnA [Bacteroidales bacterium]
MDSLREVVQKAKNIVIVGHYNPDGDAVGATIGLSKYLQNQGKSSVVVFPNPFAKNLQWMDTGHNTYIYQNRKLEIIHLVQQADLIFCLDFQSMGRTDQMESLLLDSSAFKVLIDHHIDPASEQFDLCFSQVNVSSTCEMLYRVINKELDPAYIDASVASCLYAGLSTDTGSFSYSCAHVELYCMIADLIKKGLDTVQIHRNIFDDFSEDRMRLLGCCLSERLKVFSMYKTAYMYLSSKDMEKYNYQAGDTEGVVNYALSISGVVFAAFFTEREKKIRISFRSKGNIDVNVFARELFHGGGHKNAAGGSMEDSLSNTIKKFEDALPEFYNRMIYPLV